MTPEDLVALALEAAEEGLRAGEMPIGAVVALGDEVIGRGFTSERARGRRLVHADLLAMIEADERLGWSRREQPLRLGITMEPCLMCFGTALTLGVSEISYGLAAPDDGAAGVPAVWQPGTTDGIFFPLPALTGGFLLPECRDQFRRYAAMTTKPHLRRYAEAMAGTTAGQPRRVEPGGGGGCTSGHVR
ncbi:nucleoside deaminase [Actinoplanes philippinensis]|uniref:nucleoside deaminase n=1 Tax=Actinoplanes philippinensis TaxID=35752 RepID=UPI003402663A